MDLNLILIQSLAKFSQAGMDKRSGGIIVMMNNNTNWANVNDKFKQFKAKEPADPNTLQFFSRLKRYTPEYLLMINQDVNFIYKVTLDKLSKNATPFKQRMLLKQSADLSACYIAFTLAPLRAELPELTGPEFAAVMQDIMNLLIRPICEAQKLPLTERMSIGFPLSSINIILDSLRFTVGVEPGGTRHYSNIIVYVSHIINNITDKDIFLISAKRKKYFAISAAEFALNWEFTTPKFYDVPDSSTNKCYLFEGYPLKNCTDFNSSPIPNDEVIHDNRFVQFLMLGNTILTCFHGLAHPEYVVQVKQGDLLISLSAMTAAAKDLFFREGSVRATKVVQQGTPGADWLHQTYMHQIDVEILPMQEDKMECTTNGETLIIERDFKLFANNYLRIYKRFISMDQTCIEIDPWQEMEKPFAAFFSLMVAVIAQKESNKAFIARDPLFTHFLFEVTFEAAEALFTKAAQIAFANRDTIQMTFHQYSKERDKAHTFGDPQLKWPSGVEGISTYENELAVVESVRALRYSV